MIERIKYLISQMGLSTRAFSIKCGIKQNTLSNQINGNRELSLSTVKSILATFPEVSPDWLILGVGDMRKASGDEESNDKINNLIGAIATMQESINAKNATIAALTERIKQLENQLKTK